ncbi:MAG: hypothetical protein NC293_10000 [Roseburia sp.]|nr:hypothetical protein [Roseburia sp.]
MVSTMTMILMVACVLVGIAVLAIPYLMINRRSSKLETGLPGAVGYGFLGYIWQYIIYMFLGLFVMRMPLWQSMNKAVSEFLVNLLLTLVTTGCTAASLYWGLYLTNQKRISIYRSAAVGIGYSLGKIGMDLIYPYLYSVYFSFQINSRTFHADEEIKSSILSTTNGQLISGTYKCILMFVIIFAITLVMGHYYISQNKKMTWLSVLVSYEIIMLLNVILRYVTGGAYDVVFMILFTVIAAAGGLILYRWFATGEVEKNPLVIINAMRAKSGK